MVMADPHFGERLKWRTTESSASDGAVGNNAAQDEAAASCRKALSTEKKYHLHFVCISSTTYVPKITLPRHAEKPSEIWPDQLIIFVLACHLGECILESSADGTIAHVDRTHDNRTSRLHMTTANVAARFEMKFLAVCSSLLQRGESGGIAVTIPS
jgi:hypothetical protein